MPKGVETPEQLLAFYAENRRCLLRGQRRPMALPGERAAPDAPRKRLTLLPPPAEPLGSMGVHEGEADGETPAELERFLVERCETLGLRVADMRAARRNDDLIGWRQYLIFEIKTRFPAATNGEIGRLFARDRSTVCSTLAKLERLEAAGLLKPPSQRAAGGHVAVTALGHKAYAGETMLDYVRRRSREFGFDPRDVRSKRRSRDLVKARHLIVLELSVNYPLASYPQLARAIGFKDHTSALHAKRKMDAAAENGFAGYELLLERGAC